MGMNLEELTEEVESHHKDQSTYEVFVEVPGEETDELVPVSKVRYDHPDRRLVIELE